MSVPRRTARPEAGDARPGGRAVSMRDLLASLRGRDGGLDPAARAPVPAKCTPDHREAA